MASAADIISYIGIPLAVLGVLPILYTFALAFVTQRRIRRALLQNGHKPVTSHNRHDGFSIRGSPMTSLIEIELPKYAIAPLDRGSTEYWELSHGNEEMTAEHSKLLQRSESTLSMIEEGRVRGFLRGGSWRAFNWKKLPIGKKMYRIQYEDELREPPAEIDFNDLINYLLDWGALPHSSGWEKLRTGGLWTPAGTVLLSLELGDDLKGKSSDGWVLRTGTPDESDGVLSLCVRWPTQFDAQGASRDATSLPPGWARISPSHCPANAEDPDQNRNEELKLLENHYGTSLRFHTEAGHVTEVQWETLEKENGRRTATSHLGRHELGMDWFTCAMAAVTCKSDGQPSLWGVEFPTAIAEFVLKDSVPCGVMVLLDLLPEDQAPEWTVREDPSANHQRIADRMMRQHSARLAAERLEATMTPQQRAVHKNNRDAEARREMMQDHIRNDEERKEREARRNRDAVNSAKITNKLVASRCMAWLIKQGHVGSAATLEEITGTVLMLLIVDNKEDGETSKIMSVLKRWMGWCAAGGMKLEELHDLHQSKREFCYAACIVAAISEALQNDRRQAGMDMLECLKSWRKVRLG